MKLPKVWKKKALFLIDIQPKTFASQWAFDILEKVEKFIRKIDYDAYVVSEYYAPKSSMWRLQTRFSRTRIQVGKTDENITNFLELKENVLFLEKTVRSSFLWENFEKVISFLNEKNIDEIHFVGFDLDDCVLNSCYDAQSLWFYSFVIEELCGHVHSNKVLIDAWLTLLRNTQQTNNSINESLNFEEIDFLN